MGFTSSIRAQCRPYQAGADGVLQKETNSLDLETTRPQDEEKITPPHAARVVPHGSQEIGGVAKIEAVETVWGKKGRYILWAGLAMMMIIFELDNSTVYSYMTYASSSFNKLSLLATLSTTGAIISAIFKPPIAKISDVIGRGEAFCITTSFYVLSYILCASSASFNIYACGFVFYCTGQTGTSILVAIMVSDISPMKWRGVAYNLVYIPFLLTPWVSAFIVGSVVDGIGWRWGIGMFAILMPFCASFIIITLLFFQRKARRAGMALTQKLNVYEFCSQIDLGGVCILCVGFAMLLLPITLAASSTGKWKTPWIDALIALGIVSLFCLYPYERYVAKHPVVPPRYFKNWSILFAVLLGCFDNIGFSGTHTYLYAWSVVAHNYSARDATFLNVSNGVMQCLVGLLVGLVMYKTRSYRWIAFVGTFIRLIGYGVMIRLRGANNTNAELFVVQLIQGTGSGIIETTIVVAAQVVVPHAELAQVTALVLLGVYLGSGIGSAIAGGIYTDTMKGRLRYHLGAGVNQTEIDTLYNSITGVLPTWGTPERIAVNDAYSDVMRYISIAAAILSVPMIIFAWFTPDKHLGEGKNLVGSSKAAEIETAEK